jgi:signal transduction histidine kinase
VPLLAGYSDGADVLLLGAFVLVPWGAGRAVCAQRRQAEQLRVLARRLTAERDARARLAVTEERTRAARDLHDSIAHSVSVMVLQAGAAEAVLATAPERARAAMRAVTVQGRRALEELRAVLGVLDPGAVPPAPGLDRLDALINAVRRAGLPAEVCVRGQRVPLPPAVEASAYRIIQEALTNALKHAGSAPTTVTLAYAPAALAVEIRDAGASRPARSGGGHGLVGMRERAAAHGGALQAGGRESGGYSVRADLPLSGMPA